MEYRCFSHWKEQAAQHGYIIKSSDDIDNLIEELWPDHEASEIAEIFGVSANAIRVHRKALGLHDKPDGNRYLFGEKDVEEFYALYQQGWSCERIGKEYNASWKCVCDTLKRYGYSLRPQGGFRHRNGRRKKGEKQHGKNI